MPQIRTLFITCDQGIIILILSSTLQVRSLHDRGVRAAKINDFTEAMKNYNEALEIDDKDTSVLHARSLAYLQMGDFSSALMDSESIINIKPQSSQVGCSQFVLKFCETVSCVDYACNRKYKHLHLFAKLEC